MYMELEVPLDRFTWATKKPFGDSLIRTWGLMDDDPYVEPRETPYFNYLAHIKKNKDTETNLVKRVLYKMALYDKIKIEGFLPYKQTRMTGTFQKDNFYIRNGHHRLSMVQHLGEPNPLTILLWIPEKSGKTDVYL